MVPQKVLWRPLSEPREIVMHNVIYLLLKSGCELDLLENTRCATNFSSKYDVLFFLDCYKQLNTVNIVTRVDSNRKSLLICFARTHFIKILLFYAEMSTTVPHAPALSTCARFHITKNQFFGTLLKR